MKRIDKENYYLDIAETVLERSTCLRRCYGAIIVKNDEIVSPATTAPPGTEELHGPGATAPGRPCRCPAASGTSCAAPSTRR